MFWKLSIFFDFPILVSSILRQFSSKLEISQILDFSLKSHVGRFTSAGKLRFYRKLIVVCVGGRLTWFLFESLFVYKHLAIKATCSRLRLNYACGKAPLSLTIMANAFSAWSSSVHRGSYSLRKSNRMRVKGLPKCYRWELTLTQPPIIARADKLIIYNL